MVPYKLHTSKTIENIVDKKESSVPCEESTIYRIQLWFDEKKEYFCNSLRAVAVQLGYHLKSSALSLLHQIKDMVGNGSDWLKRLVRILVNSNSWVHTRSVFVT